MGTLYVVGTPIGNLEDLSLRAIRVLRQVKLIAAEDTRETRKLLARYEIATPLTSYFEHNKLAKLDHLLQVLRDGDVALVSDAGMPGISDPGYELVRAALAAGLPVTPVPGPSAVVTALAVSGLPTDQFVYLGFLPRRPTDRRRVLAENAADRRTLVAYESPHRLAEALDDVLAVLGDRPVAAAGELTKLFEEVIRGSATEVRAHFAERGPKGEYTLVIGGAPPPRAADDTAVERELRARLEEDLPPKELASAVAKATGRASRDVYRLLLSMGRHGKI